jgi:hypothetical protein
MSTEEPGSPAPEAAPGSAVGRWGRRNRGIAAGVIAAVVVGGIVLAAVLGSNGAKDAGISNPSQSATPGPSVTSTASGSATPAPSASASANPSTPAPPVAIDKPATISPGLTAQITKLESVQGEAKTPGEVAGPAVRMTVTISNTTSAAASLATTVVTAYYGADQTPALELSAPGGSPLPAEVAAGTTVTGVYIFTVPTDKRNDVRIEVDYSVTVQPLVFEGPAPS